jgi:hypothetical protein
MTSPNQESITKQDFADHMLELAILKFINCSKSTNILLLCTKKILDKKTHGYNFFKFLLALGCTPNTNTTP